VNTEQPAREQLAGEHSVKVECPRCKQTLEVQAKFCSIVLHDDLVLVLFPCEDCICSAMTLTSPASWHAVIHCGAAASLDVRQWVRNHHGLPPPLLGEPPEYRERPIRTIPALLRDQLRAAAHWFGLTD
jgi:hypothetical protein